jgi:hypothetical protein
MKESQMNEEKFKQGIANEMAFNDLLDKYLREPFDEDSREEFKSEVIDYLYEAMEAEIHNEAYDAGVDSVDTESEYNQGYDEGYSDGSKEEKERSGKTDLDIAKETYYGTGSNAL